MEQYGTHWNTMKHATKESENLMKINEWLQTLDELNLRELTDLINAASILIVLRVKD